ncbi:HlyD family efflux transporter periplasmic adaptor subunit [Flavitalea flava]
MPTEQPRRSEAATELISARPDFLSRWALWLFLLLLLLLLASSWFIKYPDIIQSNAKLTATNAPMEIMPRQDGKLIRLFVNNDTIVQQDQMIAWIQSTASHENVITLSSLLKKGIGLVAENETEKVSGLFIDHFFNLGELQTAYQHFTGSWMQFNDYLVNGYYYQKKKTLLADLSFLRKLNISLRKENDLTQQDIQLTQESVDSSNSLYADKVISKEDFRQQRSRLVNRQLSLPQLNSAILTNENQQINKEKEINELEHTISQQKVLFLQELQTIKSLVDDWISRFIIKAPSAGKIVFIVPLQENQFIQSGRSLGFVNPFNTHYYAQVNLPQYNLGKATAGQKVQLRFDAYPYQEFGVVNGNLDYISKISTDSGFLATITLPEGLMTDYKKEIQYRYGLKSQALIITQNKRLLERFYYSFRNGVSR